MDPLRELSRAPRVSVRRAGPPDPEGKSVVFWMQRAQRGVDNPALNVAVEAERAAQAGGGLSCAPAFVQNLKTPQNLGRLDRKAAQRKISALFSSALAVVTCNSR